MDYVLITFALISPILTILLLEQNFFLNKKTFTNISLMIALVAFITYLCIVTKGPEGPVYRLLVSIISFFYFILSLAKLIFGKYPNINKFQTWSMVILVFTISLILFLSPGVS